MNDIGTVIGWKFNHQSGMQTKEGIITKFPGDIPSQADQDLWTIEYMDSEDFKLANLRKDKDYPRASLVIEALLENVRGNPNKLNVIATDWNTLKTKHGI